MDTHYKQLIDIQQTKLHLVVVVVVVVGQTVGPISSKTLAYDCLCTLELCTASMLPVNSEIWGIFCPVFVQAILERVHCSAGYNFIW